MIYTFLLTLFGLVYTSKEQYLETHLSEHFKERRREEESDKDKGICLDCLDKELRFAKLEAQVKALTTQVAVLQNENIKTQAELAVTLDALKSMKGACGSTWTMRRTEIIFENLEKLMLHQSTPTYIEPLPLPLPDNTRAIIIQVYCMFWNSGGHAYLDVDIHQKGNEEGGVASVQNTHFDIYANTINYEVFVPWDSSISNEVVFDVTRSYQTGGSNNWYRLRIVGYVMA